VAVLDTVIRRCRLVTSRGELRDAYIVVRDGTILEVGEEPYTGLSAHVVNAEGLYVVAGFVDTHTHGVRGVDFTANREPSRILQASREYVKYGVTSILATTVTAPLEDLVEACKAVREAMSTQRGGEGARILGVHLEGPYINPEMAGAQNRAYIRPPSINELKVLVEASGNTIRQITIAPELPGALELIRYARAMGITVSAGHTNATYEEGVLGVEAGITKASHLFNAMRRFHHREPGVSLALLQSPQVYLEVIVDFVHLHPAVVRMIIDYAKPHRVVLVTDSIAATGMPDGVYELGGLKVVVERGVCKLADSGALAGSVLTMDRAVKNIYSLGYSLRDVVLMSSTVPAKSINAKHVGDVDKGYFADLVFLDEELNVVKTIVGGEVVYEK
jgi:N-acetylglucosamine-6-phosphate deacetylase